MNSRLGNAFGLTTISVLIAHSSLHRYYDLEIQRILGEEKMHIQLSVTCSVKQTALLNKEQHIYENMFPGY